MLCPTLHIAAPVLEGSLPGALHCPQGSDMLPAPSARGYGETTDTRKPVTSKFCIFYFILAFLPTDEMIYDDVENGEEGGNSSLEYGWSSSEFESYEEQSDSECKNGVPRSFLRSNHKKQVRVKSV